MRCLGGTGPRVSIRPTCMCVGLLASVALAAVLLACGGEPGVPIEGRELTVACGSCVFDMPEAKNCPWAAELDGHHYLLMGKVPLDHNSHLPDGICNMPRRARIDGELRGGVIHVASMLLLDPEPGSVPEHPSFTPADIH